MSLKTYSAKVIGTPNESGWTQTHEFVPEDLEKLLKRGHVFAVISTKKKETGIDSVTAGRELLARLHEEYFGNLEVTPFIALKSAVEKVLSEFLQTWGDVEIAAISKVEDVVYSAAGGGGRISIYRSGGIAPILESVKSQDVVAASGYPKTGDYIILGTSLFFESIPFGVLKGALEGPDLNSSVESLAPQVATNLNSGGIGAVIVGFKDETIIEKVGQSVASPPVNIRPSILLGKLKNIFSRLIPERKIYVREKSLEEAVGLGKKTTVLVGVILLGLLVVSIVFGVVKNKEKRYKASYQEELTQARNNLNEALQIFETNPSGAGDLYIDARAKVDTLLSKNIKDKEVLNLDGELKQRQGDILGVIKVETSLYMDLSLLSSGFSGDKVILSGGNLFVFDRNGKKVVKIVIDTKKTQVVVGPEQLDGASDVFAYQDSVYGVFSDGIYQLGADKKKVMEKSWDGEIVPYAYTGNIYVLDKSANQVWRYAGGGGAFGAKQSWLAASVKPNFQNVKQIVIDSSIWVLTSTSNISKFSQGNPQAFKISGVSPEISNIQAIHTNEENIYIYLLDKEQGRIVVLEKNGNYKSQYTSETLKEGLGLIVSEKNSKAIILTKGKLLQVDLK